MRRNGLPSLIFIVVLSVAGLGWTLAAGNEPLLGLDLQGGVSVTLEPTNKASDDALTQAVEIIRQRVDGLGVAEPEITRQGGNIVVQLPGVKDRDRALELVGQTAELRFRPVLQSFPPNAQEILDNASTTTTTAPGEGDDGGTSSTTTPAGEGGDEGVAPDAEEGTGDDEAGYGLPLGESAAPAFQADPTTTTTTAPTTTAPPADGSTTTTAPALDPSEIEEQLQLTPAEDDVADQEVTLAQYDDDGNEVLRFRLGPTVLTGEIVSDATAQLADLGTWQVAVDIRGSRLDEFNQVASQCFSGQAICPPQSQGGRGALAIVLDGRVISAPQINNPSYDSRGVSITGDFSESEAKDLALVLRYGSLPVELVPQQTQSVSASIGKDALDAGVLAGLIGLGLVFIYMVAYYRVLGLIAMLSLLVAGALLWTVVAWLGENQGLALTLSGVTGIILSIGVAVDSNVVFYENLKEDYYRGRTLRSTVDASFQSAFSTILKADIASLIGAAILYFLTVGQVRGFALFLGLSTVLDLVASYFFMRPLTLLAVRWRFLKDRPRWFGMPRQQAVPQGGRLGTQEAGA